MDFVTTRGGEVKRYASNAELLSFLGPIDAPQEAVLLALYSRMSVGCDSNITRRPMATIRAQAPHFPLPDFPLIFLGLVLASWVAIAAGPRFACEWRHGREP